MAFTKTNTFSSGVNTSFSSQLNTNFDEISDELNGVTTNNNVMAPIGSIVAWLPDHTGTPSTLPGGWVLCDGSTISDSDSPYDGITIPDLNGDNRFLRGADASGSTGGSETHNHGGFTSITGRGNRKGTTSVIDSNTGLEDAGGSTIRATTQIIASNSTLPTYYTVVWIMRIK